MQSKAEKKTKRYGSTDLILPTQKQTIKFLQDVIRANLNYAEHNRKCGRKQLYNDFLIEADQAAGNLARLTGWHDWHDECFEPTTPQEIIESEDIIAKATRLGVSPRTKKMLVLRYRKKMTLEEIGNLYGITRQRVQQIISKFLEII